jgi:hypothetical protein
MTLTWRMRPQLPNDDTAARRAGPPGARRPPYKSTTNQQRPALRMVARDR